MRLLLSGAVLRAPHLVATFGEQALLDCLEVLAHGHDLVLAHVQADHLRSVRKQSSAERFVTGVLKGLGVYIESSASSWASVKLSGQARAGGYPASLRGVLPQAAECPCFRWPADPPAPCQNALYHRPKRPRYHKHHSKRTPPRRLLGAWSGAPTSSSSGAASPGFQSFQRSGAGAGAAVGASGAPAALRATGSVSSAAGSLTSPHRMRAN